jgi:hypothetical protein
MLRLAAKEIRRAGARGAIAGAFIFCEIVERTGADELRPGWLNTDLSVEWAVDVRSPSSSASSNGVEELNSKEKSGSRLASPSEDVR